MVMIILMSVILWFSVVKECYASGNGYWKFLGSQQRQDPQLTGTQKEDTNFTATSIQSTYSYDWQGKKYSSASNFSWKFGKSMKSLYPGDKIPVTGMLVYGRCTPGIGAGVNAFVSLYSELKTAEGFVPSGTHTNVIGLYLAPPGGQVSKTNNIEVWQGQKGQYMAIYCTSSIMRKASIKYIYEWVEGGAPPVQTHAGWEGNWNSEWGTVSFQVRGRSVTGTFAHKNGRLAGTLSPMEEPCRADGDSPLPTNRQMMRESSYFSCRRTAEVSPANGGMVLILTKLPMGYGAGTGKYGDSAPVLFR